MSAPKGINQKGKYTALNARLNRYVLMVQSVYDTYNLEASKIAEGTGFALGDKPFRFADYPSTRYSIDQLQKKFVADMSAIIHSGTSEEWKQSNIVQDLLADKALKFYGSRAGGKKHRVYYQPNNDALKAFQQRIIGHGMNLSQTIWDQSENYKTEMEYAISSALEKGTSAVTLSKRLSKYLLDFDRLKDDYKEKYGKAVECEDCEYRSMRLARSEINMAYRTAEWTRWQQMDFVIAFDIKLSKSHHARMPKGDICDMLAGRYPKTIKWTGWHPNDMCYVVPVLMDEDDFWADEDGHSEVEVTEIPEQMKNWLADNADTIVQQEKKGTLPYWLRDNRSLVTEAKNSLKPFEMTQETRNELITRGFKSIVESDVYNESAMSGFNVLQFDKKFESICDELGYRINVKEISKTPGQITLRYCTEGEAENRIELERNFGRKKFKDGEEIPVVYHKLFTLPKKEQGHGISKRLFRDLFEQYEKCGIKKVYLHANIDVGGYCWAKYGCLGEKRFVKSSIKNALSMEKITVEEFNDAMKYVDSCGDLVPMQNLAYKSYGKRMLLESSWYGEFDLSNVTQMKYLHDYIGM